MSSFTISVNNPSDVTFTVTDGDVDFKVVKKPIVEMPETPETCFNVDAFKKLRNLISALTKSPKFRNLLEKVSQMSELKEIIKEPQILEALKDFLGSGYDAIIQDLTNFATETPTETPKAQTETPKAPTETPKSVINVPACPETAPIISIGNSAMHYKYTHIGNMVMPGMYFSSVREHKPLNTEEFAELQKMFEPDAILVVLEANGTTRLLNSPISPIEERKNSKLTIPGQYVENPVIKLKSDTKFNKLSSIVTVPEIGAKKFASKPDPKKVTDLLNTPLDGSGIDLDVYYQNMIHEYTLHEMFN